MLPRMTRTLCLFVLMAITCRSAAAESIYLYEARPDSGPDYFEGDLLTRPFASEMVFTWQATAGNVFALDSLGETLELGARLGLYSSSSQPFDPTGITLRELRVTLSGVTGQINIPASVIAANIPMNSTATVPEPDVIPNMYVVDGNGYWANLQISGTGTFSSISFALIFDGAGAGQLGMPFDSIEWTTGTPTWPAFYTVGTEATGYLIVVPEPSPFLHVASGAGLACLMWRNRRRVC